MGRHIKIIITGVLVLFVSVVVGLGRSGSFVSFGDIEWTRTYGGIGTDVTLSVIQTSDGGYALAGYTTSYTYQNTSLADVYFVKTDDSGNMEWNMTYGFVYDECARSVIQTNDEGYALAGYMATYSSADDVYLVKTDSLGKRQWSKMFGGGIFDFGYSVVQTSDYGFAVAGCTDASSGAGGLDFYLVKTNSSGSMKWAKTYGGMEDDEAISFVETNDGGFALAGYTKSYGANNTSDFWLVKTDALGNAEWNKTYGGVGLDEAYSILRTNDNGYLLAGWTDSFGAGASDFFLVKTDASGNMQWNRTLGGAKEDVAWSVVQTSDSGYLLAGSTESFGLGNKDVWLVKTDVNGEMQGNRTYGGVNDDWAYSLIQTSDGGYAVTGETCSFGTGTPDHPDAWLIKLEPNSFVPELPSYLLLAGLLSMTMTVAFIRRYRTMSVSAPGRFR